MKCGKELARSSLRLSAGYLTKEEDFSKVLLVLREGKKSKSPGHKLDEQRQNRLGLTRFHD
jgi:cysteine sulfinate desulfinase/cysteine desulfurase-like protein